MWLVSLLLLTDHSAAATMIFFHLCLKIDVWTVGHSPMKEQISSFLTGTVPYMLLPRKAPEALPTSLLYCDILTQEADGSVKAVMN